MEVIINGIHYVPACSAQPDPNPKVAVAVYETVMALHLGPSNRPRARFWDILNALDPQLAELIGIDEQLAVEAATARVDVARKSVNQIDDACATPSDLGLPGLDYPFL